MPALYCSACSEVRRSAKTCRATSILILTLTFTLTLGGSTCSAMNVEDMMRPEVLREAFAHRGLRLVLSVETLLAERMGLGGGCRVLNISIPAL